MIARSHHFTLSILLTFGLLVALCLTPSGTRAEMGATEEDHHLLGDDPYRRQNRGGTRSSVRRPSPRKSWPIPLGTRTIRALGPVQPHSTSARSSTPGCPRDVN